MDDISKLKKQIIIYGGLTALIGEVVSFFILGINLGFFISLIAGYGIAVINFFLMAYFINQMLSSGNQGMSAIGYFLRMILYCIVFYFCVKHSFASGMACLIGILSTKIPMFYFYALRHKLDKNRKIRPEVQAIYDEEDKQAEDEFYGRDTEIETQEED